MSTGGDPPNKVLVVRDDSNFNLLDHDQSFCTQYIYSISSIAVRIRFRMHIVLRGENSHQLIRFFDSFFFLSVASAADPTDAPLTPSPDLLCYTSCIQEPRSPAECFVSCPAFCPANCTSQFNGRCDYKIGRCICAQYYFKGDNCSTPIVDEKPYTKPFTDEGVFHSSIPPFFLL
jgi:hypothetical protein